MNHATEGDRLRHVYWLGGSPCSGKSTIADLIQQRYAVDVYHVDDAVRARFGPYDAATQPCMHRWTVSLANGEVTWDDIWLRPVDALLDEVFQCYGEQFDLVIADLLSMPSDCPLLVEGNSLLPARLMPYLQDPSRALWLVASAEFQRREYPRRGAWVQHILSQCSDRDRALQNWMDRDIEFAKKIAEDVARRQPGRLGGGHLDSALITVDGTRSIEQNMRLVVDRFGSLPQKGIRPA